MRIKEVLKEKGVTQTMLANAMGVSKQSITQTLSASSITTTTLEKIATALNVPIWQLFVSPEEVTECSCQINVTHIICPHCGKTLVLHIGKQ